jgi:hypothetical protein
MCTVGSTGREISEYYLNSAAEWKVRMNGNKT